MILITGTSGFIGFHTALFFLRKGFIVYGIDNVNNYYNVKLKEDRNKILMEYKNYHFLKANLEDFQVINEFFKGKKIKIIIHLAAQAGVRYSLKNPFAYCNSNLAGTLSILELAKILNIEKLIYASSSSVYGNEPTPFKVSSLSNRPISFYGATKLANELMAYSYYHNYKIPSIGLRFFTVYGPWGRPDMAYFSFLESLFDGKTIELFNFGDMKRSYTYISDVVDAIFRCTELDFNDYRIYNIGNPVSVPLKDLVTNLEIISGIKANIIYSPKISADVKETESDISETRKDLGFNPSVEFFEGLKHFYKWFCDYYKK